jgi:hypothetical protein
MVHSPRPFDQCFPVADPRSENMVPQNKTGLKYKQIQICIIIMIDINLAGFRRVLVTDQALLIQNSAESVLTVRRALLSAS